MVTAELAVGSLAAVIILVVLGWGLSLAVAQLRLTDVAAEVARQLARGDDAAVRAAEQRAPRGALMTVGTEGDMVVVTARLDVRPAAGLPAVSLSAAAQTRKEPE